MTLITGAADLCMVAYIQRDPESGMPPKAYYEASGVNGPWRITLEWRNPDIWLVDLEQYH